LGTSEAYKQIRKVVPPLENDRELHLDIQKILTIVKDGSLLDGVEKKVKLN
jgi:histidine ammonia-lyase